ncbi:hypothetical protein NLI96_g6242 [Meripilus lineatus]|uniref:Uncharacterized protein n=1 Tax=Meripilus lineatus TaxID=2056292 RepID=A0AAD5V318_9APHY|nr:hypothetical protein NLI96_g6242 [Physisporinus lineatus]
MAYKNFIHKDRLAADRISSSSTLSGGLGSISRAGRRVVPQLPPSGLANYPFSDINISFDTVGAYSGTGVSVSELLARNERTLASTMVNPYDAIIVEEVCELKLLVSWPGYPPLDKCCPKVSLYSSGKPITRLRLAVAVAKAISSFVENVRCIPVDPACQQISLSAAGGVRLEQLFLVGLNNPIGDAIQVEIHLALASS